MPLPSSVSTNLRDYLRNVAEMILVINAQVTACTEAAPSTKISSTMGVKRFYLTTQNEIELESLQKENNVTVLKKKVISILKTHSDCVKKAFIWMSIIHPKFIANPHIGISEKLTIAKEINNLIMNDFPAHIKSPQWEAYYYNMLLWDFYRKNKTESACSSDQVFLLEYAVKNIEEIARKHHMIVGSLLFERSFIPVLNYYQSQSRLLEFINEKDSQGNTSLHYLMIRFYFKRDDSFDEIESILVEYKLKLLDRNVFNETPLSILIKKMFYEEYASDSLTEKRFTTLNYLMHIHANEIDQIFKTPLDSEHTILGLFLEKTGIDNVAQYIKQADLDVEMSVTRTILDISFEKHSEMFYDLFLTGVKCNTSFICRILKKSMQHNYPKKLEFCIQAAKIQGIYNNETSRAEILISCCKNLNSLGLRLLIETDMFNETLSDNVTFILSMLSYDLENHNRKNDATLKNEITKEYEDFLNTFVKIIKEKKCIAPMDLITQSVPEWFSPLLKAILVNYPAQARQLISEDINILNSICAHIKNTKAAKKEVSSEFLAVIFDSGLIYTPIFEKKHLEIIFDNLADAVKLNYWANLIWLSQNRLKDTAQNLDENIVFVEKKMQPAFEMVFSHVISNDILKNREFTLPFDYFFNWLKKPVQNLNKKSRKILCHKAILWLSNLDENQSNAQPLSIREIAYYIEKAFGGNILLETLYEHKAELTDLSLWDFLFEESRHILNAILLGADIAAIAWKKDALSKEILLDILMILLKKESKSKSEELAIETLFERINDSETITLFYNALGESPKNLNYFIELTFNKRPDLLEKEILTAILTRKDLTIPHPFYTFAFPTAYETLAQDQRETIFNTYCSTPLFLEKALHCIYHSTSQPFDAIQIISKHTNREKIVQDLDVSNDVSLKALCKIIDVTKGSIEIDFFSASLLTKVYLVEQGNSTPSTKKFLLDALCRKEWPVVYPLLIGNQLEKELILIFCKSNRNDFEKTPKGDKEVIFSIIHKHRPITAIKKMAPLLTFDKQFSAMLKEWISEFSAKDFHAIRKCLPPNLQAAAIQDWIVAKIQSMDYISILQHIENPFDYIKLKTEPCFSGFLSNLSHNINPTICAMLPPSHIVFGLSHYIFQCERKPHLSIEAAQWVIDNALSYLYMAIASLDTETLNDFEKKAQTSLLKNGKDFYSESHCQNECSLKTTSLIKLIQAWNRLIKLRFHYRLPKNNEKLFLVPFGLFHFPHNNERSLEKLEILYQFAQVLKAAMQPAITNIFLYGSLSEMMIMNVLQKMQEQLNLRYASFSDHDLLVVVDKDADFDEQIQIFRPLVIKQFGEAKIYEGLSHAGFRYFSMRCFACDINLSQGVTPHILAVENRLSLFDEYWGEIFLSNTLSFEDFLSGIDKQEIMVSFYELYQASLKSHIVKMSVNTWVNLIKCILRIHTSYACQVNLEDTKSLARSVKSEIITHAFSTVRKNKQQEITHPQLQETYLAKLTELEKTLASTSTMFYRP